MKVLRALSCACLSIGFYTEAVAVSTGIATSRKVVYWKGGCGMGEGEGYYTITTNAQTQIAFSVKNYWVVGR